MFPRIRIGMWASLDFSWIICHMALQFVLVSGREFETASTAFPSLRTIRLRLSNIKWVWTFVFHIAAHKAASPAAITAWTAASIGSTKIIIIIKTMGIKHENVWVCIHRTYKWYTYLYVVVGARYPVWPVVITTRFLPAVVTSLVVGNSAGISTAKIKQ